MQRLIAIGSGIVVTGSFTAIDWSAGWHVPTSEDWNVLTDYYGGRTNTGGRMKATGTILWDSPNSTDLNVFNVPKAGGTSIRRLKD